MAFFFFILQLNAEFELLDSAKAWVALGKSLPEFVYFVVEICHRGPLPSATPAFSLWQKPCESANLKDAEVLGWGRQILEKSNQTTGITAVTVNVC